MRWWRRGDERHDPPDDPRTGWPAPAPPGRRLPRSEPDPVAAAVRALAAEALVPRYDGEDPRVDDLPDLIEVSDEASMPGFNTVVVLADEVASFFDAYDDGLEVAVAEQPGVRDVLAEDREVLFLDTDLDLADVHALLVRVVVDVNRNPRQPAPTGALTAEEVSDLVATADGVRAAIGAAGFAPGPQHSEATYFERRVHDGFAQVLMFAPAGGQLADGTDLVGRVWVDASVVVPELFDGDMAARARFVPADGSFTHRAHPAPGGLPAAVHEALAWLEQLSDRAGLAAWFGEDPGRLTQPFRLPRLALLLAEWERRPEAARVLTHLDRRWGPGGLAGSPEALRARSLLGL